MESSCEPEAARKPSPHAPHAQLPPASAPERDAAAAPTHRLEALRSSIWLSLAAASAAECGSTPSDACAGRCWDSLPPGKNSSPGWHVTNPTLKQDGQTHNPVPTTTWRPAAENLSSRPRPSAVRRTHLRSDSPPTLRRGSTERALEASPGVGQEQGSDGDGDGDGDSVSDSPHELAPAPSPAVDGEASISPLCAQMVTRPRLVGLVGGLTFVLFVMVQYRASASYAAHSWSSLELIDWTSTRTKTITTHAKARYGWAISDQQLLRSQRWAGQCTAALHLRSFVLYLLVKSRRIRIGLDARSRKQCLFLLTLHCFQLKRLLPSCVGSIFCPARCVRASPTLVVCPSTCSKPGCRQPQSATPAFGTHCGRYAVHSSIPAFQLRHVRTSAACPPDALVASRCRSPRRRAQ